MFGELFAAPTAGRDRNSPDILIDDLSDVDRLIDTLGW
jgi:hypothetical protein